MIAPNSRTRKGGKERWELKGKYGWIWGAEEENVNYGLMVQPSQKNVAPSAYGKGLSEDWAREVWE